VFPSAEQFRKIAGGPVVCVDDFDLMSGDNLRQAAIGFGHLEWVDGLEG
jgi:hypothetical protein